MATWPSAGKGLPLQGNVFAVTWEGSGKGLWCLVDHAGRGPSRPKPHTCGDPGRRPAWAKARQGSADYSYIVLSIRSIWGYVNITTGFFKNSHPPTCCHITPDPSAPPWSMLLPNACPHPNRNGCFFEGLSKQSDVTTLTSGKGGMQVSSQWVWQDGCFFWRTRYVSLAFACSAARIVRRDLLHQAAK